MKGKLGVGIVLLMGLLIGGGIFLWNQSYEKVDLGEYAQVRFEGYDTVGEAILEWKAPDDGSVFWDTVTVSLDRYRSLGNGEEVLLYFKYDEAAAKAAKIRITGGNRTIEVNGLPALRNLSPQEVFQDISLSYSGISPRMTAEICNQSENDLLRKLEYAFAEKKEYYASGDKVTVVVNIAEEDANTAGYHLTGNPEAYRMEYQVPTGISYLMDGNRLTEANLQELVQHGASLFTEKTANEYGVRVFTSARVMYYFVGMNTSFIWQNPRPISVYFFSPTEEKLQEGGGYANYLQICYDATLYQRCDGVAVPAEVIVQYSDITIDESGEIHLPVETGSMISASHNDSEIKKIVSSQSQDYRMTKLSF